MSLTNPNPTCNADLANILDGAGPMSNDYGFSVGDADPLIGTEAHTGNRLLSELAHSLSGPDKWVWLINPGRN